MNDNQMADDLRKHLSSRIKALVGDVFDTSVRAGFDKSEAVAIVFVSILHELVLIADGAGINPRELGQYMRQHFEDMEEKKNQRREALQ